MRACEILRDGESLRTSNRTGLLPGGASAHRTQRRSQGAGVLSDPQSRLGKARIEAWHTTRWARENAVFYDAALGDSKVGTTTMEHQMIGIQSLLGGESVARYMVWDGIRSLDLLQSLPYVDAKRIGVSGCSGGGTLTTYLAAVDERIHAAAPSCYITDWEHQLLGTGPADAEQEFPDELRNGLDHADLVEAFAPKPYLICSTTEDYFPIEAHERHSRRARAFTLFWAHPRKLQCQSTPGATAPRKTSARRYTHGWTAG